MARPRPAPRRRAAWWVVSALLHVAALALLLVSPRPEQGEGDAQPSYDVVFADPTPDQPALPDPGDDAPAPPVPPDPNAERGARPPEPDAPSPEPAPPEPAPPEPAPPEPAPAEPAPPEPLAPEPAPRPPPNVRLAEPDMPELLRPPPPVPIPDAPPPLPPRPAAPPRPRPQQQARRFPAPIDLNFGPANPGRPAPGSVASRALDLSIGPAKPGSLRATSDLRSPRAAEELMAALESWWVRHSYYPGQAAQAGEEGTVRIRLQADRFGKVVSVELQSRSGSPWLDMAALGTFRNAKLAVPSNAGETFTVDLTVNYVLVRR